MFQFIYNMLIYVFAIIGAFEFGDLMGGIVTVLFCLSLCESFGGFNAR